jgi:hypothetical protein
VVTNFNVWLLTLSNSLVLETNLFPGTNITVNPTNIVLTGATIYATNGGQGFFGYGGNLTNGFGIPMLWSGSSAPNNGDLISNIEYTNIVLPVGNSNLTTAGCLNGSGGTGTGAAISNYPVNLTLVAQSLIVSNNVAFTNTFTGSYAGMTNGWNTYDIYLQQTNTAATYYLYFVDMGLSNFNGGMTNPWPLTNAQGRYHFHMSCFNTNFSNCTWEASNPGQ